MAELPYLGRLLYDREAGRDLLRKIGPLHQDQERGASLLDRAGSQRAVARVQVPSLHVRQRHSSLQAVNLPKIGQVNPGAHQGRPQRRNETRLR